MLFRLFLHSCFFGFTLLSIGVHTAFASNLELRGKGWYQFGRVMHSSDTLNPVYNYQGNWFQHSGAQFTVVADIGEDMQGALGLGGQQFHSTQGAQQESYKTKLGFSPYITEARFTYTAPPSWAGALTYHFGLFPYHYQSDARNLGAYLLRGPVYPGILISEFESTSLDTTIGNVLGFQVRQQWGEVFTHDLILRSEIDAPPVFDMSLAYVASLKIGKAVEFGGGIHFHRLIPSHADITHLRDNEAFRILLPEEGQHPYESDYAYVRIRDTVLTAEGPLVRYDTTRLSHQGIKMMARAALDLKAWFGEVDFLGPRDLRLYLEAAIVGWKDYAGIYPDRSQRIPVMAGFNLPTFRLLDEFVVEVEWYGALFRDDYSRIYKATSPVPANNGPLSYDRQPDENGLLGEGRIVFADPYDVTHMKKDNWKWSLYASKTFAGCLKMSLQAANDHFRPNTPLNSNVFVVERMDAAATTLKDWNLMFRMGFFF